MASGWIDIHGHFSMPKTTEEAHQSVALARQGRFLMDEPYIWTPTRALSHMDQNGTAFQFLSNIPTTSLQALQASNSYGAALAAQHPSRFGLLAALPTDNASDALAEIARVTTGDLAADGYAVSCCYNGVYLSDARLDPIWGELNRLEAVVFVHPNAYTPATMGMPAPLIEVAFETCRTVVAMLYAGHLRRFPAVRLVLAHCGGALPALSSRLELLGGEAWVPNPLKLTGEDIKAQLASLWLDCAATCPSALGPAVHMVGGGRIVYGSDCGVPCSTQGTMDRNKEGILGYEGLSREEREAIGRNLLKLFPRVAERLGMKPE